MKQVKSSSRNGVANLFTDLKGLVTGKGKRGKSQKRGSASGKSINSKYQYRYITNLSHISNLMGHRKITKIVLDKRTSYYIVAQYYTSQIQTRFKSDLSQN